MAKAFWLLSTWLLPINSAHASPADSLVAQAREAYAKGQYGEATDAFLQAIKHPAYQGPEKTHAKMLACIYLAENYRASKLFPQAEQYLEQALALPVPPNHASTLWLKSYAYNRWAAVNIEQYHYQEALSKSHAAHHFLSKANEPVLFALSWLPSSNCIHLAHEHAHLNSLDSTEFYYQKAESLLQQSEGLVDQKVLLGNNLSMFYHGNARYAEAIEAAKGVVVLVGDQPDVYRNQLIESFRFLHLSYSATGQFREAYQALGKYHEMEDLRRIYDNIRSIKDIETRYQSREKEQENQLLSIKLKRQRITNWSIAGGGVLVLLLGLAFYQRWRFARKTNHQLARQNSIIERQSAELKSIDELKTRFFANVSHELRTPLSLVSGPLHQLRQHSETLSSTQQKQVLTAFHAAGKLNDLIDEIVDLTKLDGHKLQLHPKPVMLHSFMCRVHQAFSSKAENQGVRYQLRFAEVDQALCVEIDETKCEKVLNNLLGNALKFTPGGGLVEMTVTYLPEKAQCQVQIRDTGIGMSAEEQEHIFTRYYQAENAQKREGLGIGLALSQEYVQVMQGYLQVVSAKEEGSVFTFVCSAPTCDGIAVEEPALEAAVTYSAQATEAHVLLVEDQPDMRRYLAEVLSGHFALHLAHNGKEALKMLELQHIDAIVSDMMMPEMDGLSLLRHLKAHEQHRDVPFIMLTARGDDEVKMVSLRTGVDDYMLKPFVPDELLAVLHNLLHNQAQRRQMLHKPDAETGGANADEKWLKQVRETLHADLANSQLSVALLAENVGVSERTLFRRLKSLTGLTPNNFIKELRLQKARQMLQHKTYNTVAEVAHHVGYQHRKTFTAQYVSRFGKKPSEYFQ